MFSKSRPGSDFETVQCPVCRALLGKREKAVIYKAHCSECRATFYWKPGQTKPNAVLDRDEEKRKCGCNGCGR